MSYEEFITLCRSKGIPFMTADSLFTTHRALITESTKLEISKLIGVSLLELRQQRKPKRGKTSA